MTHQFLSLILPTNNARLTLPSKPKHSKALLLHCRIPIIMVVPTQTYSTTRVLPPVLLFELMVTSNTSSPKSCNSNSSIGSLAQLLVHAGCWTRMASGHVCIGLSWMAEDALHIVFGYEAPLCEIYLRLSHP